MSYRERERFISLFRSRKSGAVIGFCVLGGMFSEGIDLAGESLIGTIIVGTGMPQLSAERNIMAAYYDEINERGRDFAYVCPSFHTLERLLSRLALEVFLFGTAMFSILLNPCYRREAVSAQPSSG